MTNRKCSDFEGGLVFEPSYVAWKRDYRGSWISVCSGSTKEETRQLSIALYDSRVELKILPYGKLPDDATEQKRGGLNTSFPQPPVLPA